MALLPADASGAWLDSEVLRAEGKQTEEGRVVEPDRRDTTVIRHLPQLAVRINLRAANPLWYDSTHVMPYFLDPFFLQLLVDNFCSILWTTQAVQTIFKATQGFGGFSGAIVSGYILTDKWDHSGKAAGKEAGPRGAFSEWQKYGSRNVEVVY